MLSSMTAYAEATLSASWGQMAWEIQAVNHRYRELSIALPEPLRKLRQLAYEQVASRVRRGKIDCRLRITLTSSENTHLALNDVLLSQLIHTATGLQKRLPTAAPLQIMDLLSWPGVSDADSDMSYPESEQILHLLDKAVEKLLVHRQREGDGILTLISERCDKLQQILDTLNTSLPEFMQVATDKMHARLARLQIDLSAERLEQEVVLLLQKLDVSEEIDRLQMHIKELRRIIVDMPTAVGRRLDFLMQEMNREANTMGSKSSHIDAINAAIEMKVLIEQIREQVQNIE